MQPSIRVHTFHGHLLNGYFGWFKRFLIILAEKFLATFTHQLLAVGTKVRQDLLTVGIGNPKKFDIMPPGLEISKLPNRKESQEFYGLHRNTLHCAFIGRVTHIKRPDRFLDVVGEIKKRGIKVDFFIAGDGELLEKCRERIMREDLPVVVLGWQSDIEKLLAAADMLALTSDNEGTPLSLIQAGMAGLPVVAIKVGSVPEIVLDDVTGIITGSGISEIADEIEKLAKDSSLREKLGSAARDFTLANFGVKRLVRDHEEIYKRLIANRAKS
jgi:glycosyltransferase involved in cell wall biosynthesis